MNPILIDNLIQARFLFEKAQLIWEPYREITNGVAVSLLQDSTELALWAIIKRHSIDIKEKEVFTSLLDKTSINGRPLFGKAMVLELNRARVSFKHSGLCPASSDIPKFIENTGFFLRKNSEEFLEINFDEISLADTVSNSELRKLIKDAELSRDSDDLQEAFILISLAFQKIQQLLLKQSQRSVPDLSSELNFHLQEIKQNEGIAFAFHQLQEFLAGFYEDYLVSTLGVNQGLLHEIQERRCQVNVAESGKRLGISTHGNKSIASLENVNFLILHTTEIARRL